MSRHLPFDDLLAALHDSGLHIGVGERLAFARLLERYDGTSREELRDAIASLVSRSTADVDLVRRTFDTLYPAGSPVERTPASPGSGAPLGQPITAAPREGDRRPTPSEPSSAGARLRGCARTFAIVVVCIALLVAGVVLNARRQNAGQGAGTRASGEEASMGPTDRPSALPQPDPSEIPFERASQCATASATIRRWPLPAFALAASTLLALLSLALYRGRTRQARWAKGAARTALLDLPGPRAYDSPWRGEPLSREALDDMITILRGALHEAEQGRELDVDRTVDATARAGLLPTFVFRPATGRYRGVVLRDTGHESVPFRAKLDSFEKAFVERGGEIEHLYFDTDFTRVSTRRGGRFVPLESLAPKLGKLPLIVLGTGRGFAPTSTARREAARKALQSWPVRVLLTPLEDPDLWPEGLTGTGALIGTWPMTSRGLLHAAAHMAALRQHPLQPASPPRAARPPLRPEDIRKLLAMLSIAPAPSFELADSLRRRFLPGAPEEIILAADTLVRPPRSGLPRDVQAAIRSFWAEGDQDLERRVRGFFLDELQRSEPPDIESPARLRWRKDVAIQRLHLATTPPAREEALRELSSLAASPLGPELRDHAQRDVDRGRALGTSNARSDALLDTVAPAVTRWAAAKSTRQRRPTTLHFRGRDVMAILGAAAIATAVMGGLGLFTGRPLPVDGSSQLLWAADDLEAGLCAFDGFYDILRDGKVTYGLAVKLDGAAARVTVPGQLIAFRLDDSFPIPRMKARVLAGANSGDPFLPAGAQHGFLALAPAGDPAFVVNYRLHRTATKAWEKVSLDAILNPGTLESKAASLSFVVIPKGEEGSAGNPSPKPRSRDDVIIVDRFEYSGADLLPMPGFVPLEQRNLAVAAHSDGIAPGTSDEVLSRLLDPGFPRWRAPATGPKKGCEGPLSSCADACVDLQSDPAHCGQCETACRKDQICSSGVCTNLDAGTDANEEPCPTGQTRCAGRCVDTQTDRSHCGECDNSCYKPTLSHHCVDGRCETCYTGYMTCDPNDTKGCQTRIADNVNHCGGCDNKCPSPPHTRTGCNFRKCTVECAGSFVDCNLDMKKSPETSDGCEIDVYSDANNCGGCGHKCQEGWGCDRGKCRYVPPPPPPPTPCTRNCDAQRETCRAKGGPSATCDGSHQACKASCPKP